MARFKMELPTEIVQDVSKIEGQMDTIFKTMCERAANATLARVKGSMPPSLRNSRIVNNFKKTVPYKTPSDDGYACKVGCWGYFINSRGKRTPAPLIANLFEYGSTTIGKAPFFRKSFQPNMIKNIMLATQRELSGGLLDE